MKKRIRKTGEIIDVITYIGCTSRDENDQIRCVDSNGEEKCLNLNYYWDLEDIIYPENIDYWGNFRNEAALKIYASRIAGIGNSKLTSNKAIDISISEADELVMKLKNRTNI